MKIFKNILNYFKSRKFKYGSNAVLMTLIVIGIIVLLNFLVYQYNIRWDLTSNQRFSISDQTRSVLQNLEDEIEIIGFFKSGSRMRNRLELLLDRYQDINDKLKVTFYDPDKKPGKAKEYNISNYGTTIIKSKKRKKKLSSRDLYKINRAQRSTQFQGEQQLTRAIMDVTKETTANIFFLKGHKELSLDKELTTLKENLTGAGYKVNGVNLAQKGIPEKADIIVAPGPKRDFEKKEINLIKDFTSKGGDLVLLLNPGVPLNHLNSFLQNWGLKARDDLVVDRKQSYYYDPVTPIPNYAGHTITQKLKEEELAVVLPMTRSLRDLGKNKENLKLNPVLRSSSQAWGEINYNSQNLEKEEEDTRGPLSLAYAVSKEIQDTTQKEKSSSQTAEASSNSGKKLIDQSMRGLVIGSSSFISNQVITKQGNMDFFLNTINWLTGKEDKISIRPKQAPSKRLVLTPVANKIIFYGSVLGIPVIVFVLGGIIWIRRRHL